MSFVESHPLEARFHMAQIISDDLQDKSDYALALATKHYHYILPRRFHHGSSLNDLAPEIAKLMTARSHSNTLKQFLDRTLRKASLNPNLNLHAPLLFSSLTMPNCDLSPLGVTDHRSLIPPIQAGSNQALTDLLCAISTNQPPLLKFTREQLRRYLLDPSSTKELTKSIPLPTRLPATFIQYIFPTPSSPPIIVFNFEPIPS